MSIGWYLNNNHQELKLKKGDTQCGTAEPLQDGCRILAYFPDLRATTRILNVPGFGARRPFSPVS